MFHIRIFMPANRLAKTLDSPAGVDFHRLVDAAERRVAALAVTIRPYVAEQIARLEAIQREGEESMFGRCREIGEAAMNIAELAGAAGRAPAGDVARGIRAMADNLSYSGLWHSDALALHISALPLLNDPDLPAKEARIVVGRLHQMRKALKVVE